MSFDSHHLLELAAVKKLGDTAGDLRAIRNSLDELVKEKRAAEEAIKKAEEAKKEEEARKLQTEDDKKLLRSRVLKEIALINEYAEKLNAFESAHPSFQNFLYLLDFYSLFLKRGAAADISNRPEIVNLQNQLFKKYKNEHSRLLQGVKSSDSEKLFTAFSWDSLINKMCEIRDVEKKIAAAKIYLSEKKQEDKKAKRVSSIKIGRILLAAVSSSIITSFHDEFIPLLGGVVLTAGVFIFLEIKKLKPLYDLDGENKLRDLQNRLKKIRTEIRDLKLIDNEILSFAATVEYENHKEALSFVDQSVNYLNQILVELGVTQKLLKVARTFPPSAFAAI